MRAELIKAVEDQGKRDYNMGLCHITHPDSEITELEMKLLYARTIEHAARNTVVAILDEKQGSLK